MKKARISSDAFITLKSGIITVDFGLMRNMGPTERLKTMIAAGKYEKWHEDEEAEVDSDITASRFPVRSRGKIRFRPKLFDFGPHVDPEEAVKLIQNEGFVPATHTHGLAYAVIFPGEQLQRSIPLLGTFWKRWSDCKESVCLSREERSEESSSKRGLHLVRWQDIWDGYWHFLGIKKLKGHRSSR